MKTIWQDVKEHKGWSMLAVAFCFMLCIFAPFENYFSNTQEFWFRPGDMIAPTFLSFIILTAVSLGFGLLIAKKFSKAFVIYGLLLSAFTALYIQGNYIPRPYGVLNGTAIDWSAYPSAATASWILMGAALVFWLLICFKIKKNIYKFGFYLCGFVFLIQIITLGTLVLQKCILAKAPQSKYVVTSKDMMNFSKDRNLIVLILDTFESRDLRRLLSNKGSKEYKDILENFTYYPDTLAGYPTTKGSLPFILSGVWYQNQESYNDYVKKAYVDNPIYEAFKKNNYDLGIYAGAMYLNNDLVKSRNIKKGIYGISSIWDFAGKLYKLAAFNYLPHQLKKYFVIDTGEFADLKQLDGAPPHSSDVQTFYNRINSIPVHLTADKRCFNFYHIDGTHPPYTFNKKLESEPSVKYTLNDEAEGNMIVLKSLLDVLRKNNVYDNSTIIVMGDHGFTDYWQNPLFIIKNAGEKHSFKISSQPMAYEYLSKIFIAAAEGKAADKNFIKNCGKDHPRRFLYYSWDTGAWWSRACLPPMYEMTAEGSVENSHNLRATGNVYLDPTVDYGYKLGTEVLYTRNAPTNSYWMLGGADRGSNKNHSEDEGKWTRGAISMFRFDFSDQKFDNLKVRIGCLKYLTPHTSVLASVNQKPVAILRGDDGKNWEFIVPHDYVKDGIMNLKLDLLSAITPDSLGAGGDIRELSLFLHDITVSSTKSEYNPAAAVYNEYVLNTVLEGSKKAPESKQIFPYTVAGFDEPGDEFLWTRARSSRLRFVLKDYHNENLQINLKFDAIENRKYTGFEVNGHTIVDLFVADKTGNDLTIDVPGNLIKDNTLDLVINVPHAKKKNMKGSKLNKRPGIAIKELSIRKASQTKAAQAESKPVKKSDKKSDKKKSDKH